MPISGSFGRFTAVQQPYEGTPNLVGPNANHGTTKGSMSIGTYTPNTLATATGPEQAFIGNNTDTTGGGYVGARQVVPTMNATGIMRDFSRYSDLPTTAVNGYSGVFINGGVQIGANSGSPVNATTGYKGNPVGVDKTGRAIASVDHNGTAATRWGLGAPTMASGAETNMGTRAFLNGAASGGHGDMKTAYIPGHEYSPLQNMMLGEGYGIDIQPVKGYGDTISGRAIVKGQIGGSFTEGSADAGYTPTYADKVRESKDRRWAMAKYSSEATLIAGNSRHTLRGVLPNTIATPYPQPGLVGGVLNKNSGIAPNARNLHLSFTVPQLFRLPTPMSDNTTLVTDGTYDGSGLGIGF
jgi:hypothetical protein